MNIDFHVLDTYNSQQAWLFVCHLLEQHYLAKQQVYLAMDTRVEAQRFDQLLWTFRDDSFIPHEVSDGLLPSNSPIIIGYEPPHRETPREFIINLSQQVPAQYDEFQHLIEVVFNDPSVQQRARERYKLYRDQQHHLNTIKQR